MLTIKHFGDRVFVFTGSFLPRFQIWYAFIRQFGFAGTSSSPKRISILRFKARATSFSRRQIYVMTLPSPTQPIN